MTRKSALLQAWATTQEGLVSLRNAPRDLHLIFALNFLESFNYFSLSLAFVLYLTDEFTIGDIQAGSYYGLWGTLYFVYGIPIGGIIDALGVKRSLLVCQLLNIVGRYIMAASQNRTLMLLSLMGPVTVAGTLGMPVLTIGVKRYTSEANRGLAFSLYYTVMNVGSLLTGLLLDLFRIRFAKGLNLAAFGPGTLLNSGLRLLLLLGCIASAIGIVLALLLEEKQPRQLHPQPERRASTDPTVPLQDSFRESETGDESLDGFKVTGRHSFDGMASPGQCFQSRWQRWLLHTSRALYKELMELCRSAEFWKFMAMCLFTINLKQIFRHLDATMPKTLVRQYGCDAPVGRIYSINPAMIIVFVPIMGVLLSHYEHFDVIHWGGYISGLSPFWIVFFRPEWAYVLFVVFLSLGEMIWSPRWYDYSMSVAPEGREGIFGSAASAPLFLAKLPTGALSGWLLGRYCPDNRKCEVHPLSPPVDVPCHASTIWLIIGLLTLSSPICILLTQRWIRPKQQRPASLPVPAAAVSHTEEGILTLPHERSILESVPLSRGQL